MEALGYTLIIEDDEGRRSVVPVDYDEVTLGRREGNTIRLKERNVSREHARLFREQGHVFAEDLGSLNGLWVNGDRALERREIFAGDVLRMGDFHVEVRGHGMPERPQSAATDAPSPDMEATQPGFRLADPEDTNPMGQQARTVVRPAAGAAAAAAPPSLPAVAAAAAAAGGGGSGAVSFPTEPEARRGEKADGAVAQRAASFGTEVEAEAAAEGWGEGGVEPLDTEKTEATSVIRLDDVGGAAVRRGGDEAGHFTGPRAKLICVSTQHAGREFVIDKSEIVIGRTADNDVAVPHRSMSRHHAKIVVTGRRFVIVDSGSANGTLVNAEEYAQTQLRGGDLIELGHVKFRFVPPGETYELNAEEWANVRAATKQRRRAGDAARPQEGHVPVYVWLVASGVVLVAVALTLVVVTGRQRGAAPWSQAPLQAGASEGAGGGAVASEAERLFGQASAAFNERQWPAAQALGNAVLAIDPTHQRASQLVAQAGLEAQAKERYDAAVAAVSQSLWGEAWSQLQEVPPESVYQGRAKPLAEQVKSALVNERLERLRQTVANSDWPNAVALADEIEALDPQRAELGELRARIPAGSQGAPKAEAPSAAGPAAAAPVRAAVAVVEGDAKQLYLEGAKALKAGRAQQAIELFVRCTNLDKEAAFCYRALGIAYSGSGKNAKAAQYYRIYLQLDPKAADAAQVRAFVQRHEGARE